MRSKESIRAEKYYEEAFYDKDYDQKHGFLNMKQRVMHIMDQHANDITRDIDQAQKELKPIEDMYRKSHSIPNNEPVDRAEFYKWIAQNFGKIAIIELPDHMG